MIHTVEDESLPYFDAQKGELINPYLEKKARKFAEHHHFIKYVKGEKLGIVEYMGNGSWTVQPLNKSTGYHCDYNSTMYTVTKAKLGVGNYEWICCCQGFKTKIRKGERGICSHIIAVKMVAGAEMSRKKEMLKID